MDDELHKRAVEIAKRILAADSSAIQLYEVGVAGANENSRLFSELVELAKQLLGTKNLVAPVGSPVDDYIPSDGAGQAQLTRWMLRKTVSAQDVT
jgi:hypothetical protein